MKNFVLKLSLTVFVVVLRGIFITCLFTGVIFANDGRAQNKKISEVYISLRLNQATVKMALESIERKTEFKFGYKDEILIGRNERLTFRVHNESVANVLKKIADQTSLSFKQVNRMILVKERSPSKKKSGNAKLLPDRTITGRVTGEQGEPLPGANVVIKGTTIGVITDREGNYRLDVPDNAAFLIVSYIGYLEQEVAVNGRSVINVTLYPDIEQLQEVVVIGYGERQKKDLTGAVSAIGSEQIERTVSMTSEMALQGTMPGVLVTNPGGDPNTRPTIRIRGVGTIGVNDPLYVIDGVPVTEFGQGAVYSTSSAAANDLRGRLNIMNLINPNDIESISVLKDASAAAIYGVRAANGVILITTKRGRTGRAKVTFNASHGFQTITRKYDVLGTEEYTAFYNEAYQNNPNELPNMPVQFDASNPEYLGASPTYDWQEELYNDRAPISDHSISISGGNEKSTYYASAGFTYTESPLKFNNNTRYNFTVSSDHEVTNWLKVGQTFRWSYVDAMDQRNISGNPADLTNFMNAPPWQPIFNRDIPAHLQVFGVDGNGNGPNGFAPSRIVNASDYSVINPTPYGLETEGNLFGSERFTDQDFIHLRNMGNFYAEITPVEGLRIRGTVSGDWYYLRRNGWRQVEDIFYRDTSPTNEPSYGERHNRNWNLLGELLIGYNRSFGDHNIDVILNHTTQKFGFESITASRQLVPRTEEQFRAITEGDNSLTSAASFEEEHALQGYMARVSYNFDSKYYVDATVRRDGSSRFAPDFRWGTFPSVGVGWRISKESFMRGFGFINDLKIRGGWGRLGNQETRAFAFLSLININPKYPLGNDPAGAGTATEGSVPANFPVSDLTWETNTTISAGFDGVFFNNKLNLTFEYYDRTTDGILQDIPLPLVVGIPSNPPLNVAEVKNSGIEISGDYTFNITRDLTIRVGGNITTVKNEVLKIFNDEPLGGNLGRIEVGQPLNFLYGYHTDGIFQTQQEVDDWQNTTSDPGNDSQKAPGDFRFKDLFGPATEDGQIRSPGADGVVNSLDQDFLGKTIAGHYYGINLTGSFRGFDIYMLFQGVGDIQQYNGARNTGEGMGSQGVNQWVTVRDRWTPQNPSTTMPRAVRGDPSGNARFSNRWVEDAGFLRWRTLQVGYTLSRFLTEKIKGDNIRVYASLSNLALITDWSGLDPENDNVPIPVITTFGISASF